MRKEESSTASLGVFMACVALFGQADEYGYFFWLWLALSVYWGIRTGYLIIKEKNNE